MLDKHRTLTGFTLKQVAEELQKPLEAKAYKGVPGGADLTDIGTAWMIEALDRVFGPAGLGWRLTYNPQEMFVVFGEKRPTAYLRSATFSYRLVEQGGKDVWVEIQTNGGSQNSEVGYALKGAVTSALGEAVSQLLWQLDVYKGKLTHHNAGKLTGGGQGVAKPVKASADGRPAAPSKGNAKLPRDPSASPGVFVIPMGKDRGKKIALLDAGTLHWYAEEMKPTSEAGKQLQAAARAYREELEARKK